MKRAPEIRFREMVPLPSLEPEIRRRGDDAQLAVRGAFDAMDRELRARIERRREPLRPPQVPT